MGVDTVKPIKITKHTVDNYTIKDIGVRSYENNTSLSETILYSMLYSECTISNNLVLVYTLVYWNTCGMWIDRLST